MLNATVGALALQTLAGSFAAYLVLSTAHWAVQGLRAACFWWARRPIIVPSLRRNVTVVISTWNEDPAQLEACVRSALVCAAEAQLEVLVVDDASDNLADPLALTLHLQAFGARCQRAYRHAGRATTQALGIRAARGEYVILLDSDTVLRPGALTSLLAPFTDPRVGIVSGMVGTANASRNRLTALLARRRWLAGHQEQAAQAVGGSLLGGPAPLLALRRELALELLPEYLATTPPGHSPDQRHLANLALARGLRSSLTHGEVGDTLVPERLGAFLRQQLHWQRAFYGELRWLVRSPTPLPVYARYDLALSSLLPALLVLALLSAVGLALTASPLLLAPALLPLILLGLLRGAPGVIAQRRLRFYAVWAYAALYLLLLPLRLWAFLRLGEDAWDTRPSSPQHPAEAQLMSLVQRGRHVL